MRMWGDWLNVMNRDRSLTCLNLSHKLSVFAHKTFGYFRYIVLYCLQRTLLPPFWWNSTKFTRQQSVHACITHIVIGTYAQSYVMRSERAERTVLHLEEETFACE